MFEIGDLSLVCQAFLYISRKTSDLGVKPVVVEEDAVAQVGDPERADLQFQFYFSSRLLQKARPFYNYVLNYFYL